MTLREGRKRGWVWVKLVGERVCASVGCSNIIHRITWVHPRAREDWCNESGRHEVQLPASRRCYLCAAMTYERERAEIRGRAALSPAGIDRAYLSFGVNRLLEIRESREKFPVYEGTSDRKWRLDGAPRGPHPCAI